MKQLLTMKILHIVFLKRKTLCQLLDVFYNSFYVSNLEAEFSAEAVIFQNCLSIIQLLI